MTEREKELQAELKELRAELKNAREALALVVQKAERLSATISEMDWAKSAHTYNEAPFGSVGLLTTLSAIREAWVAVKANRLILDAAVREANDTLNYEVPKMVQESAA